MAITLNPYLNFRDNARQAFAYYQSVLGGELDLNTFSDFQASEDPSDADKIMHAQLETDDGLVLMGADTPSSMDYSPTEHFAVSISGDDEPRLRRFWDGLSDGGEVTMPLEVAPWGDTFGMCRDRFGINWMVSIAGEQS